MLLVDVSGLNGCSLEAVMVWKAGARAYRGVAPLSSADCAPARSETARPGVSMVFGASPERRRRPERCFYLVAVVVRSLTIRMIGWLARVPKSSVFLHTFAFLAAETCEKAQRRRTRIPNCEPFLYLAEFDVEAQPLLAKRQRRRRPEKHTPTTRMAETTLSAGMV